MGREEGGTAEANGEWVGEGGLCAYMYDPLMRGVHRTAGALETGRSRTVRALVTAVRHGAAGGFGARVRRAGRGRANGGWV